MLYIVCTFQGVTSFGPKHKIQDPNIAKEALKSKHIEIESKIRRQGQLLIPTVFPNNQEVTLRAVNVDKNQNAKTSCLK